MRVIGFWDYTSPGGGGGLETYRRDDGDRLLDDMAEGGFDSLALGIKWLAMDLAEQWRMSLEDARRFQPDILWFMSGDARVDGLVASSVKLPAWGFPDGRAARLALMRLAREILAEKRRAT